MDNKVTQFPDLNQIVENWAWREYEKTATRKQQQLLSKQRKKQQKYISVNIDWSDVKFSDSTSWPKFHEDAFDDLKDHVDSKNENEQADIGKSKVSILFRTKFTNDTDETQEYTMKTEKTTRSSCTTEVETGFTKGMEMSIKLAAPGEIFEANAGYSSEFSLTDFDGQTFEEEVTWGVESTIRVKEQHVAEAQLVVNEKKFSGDFQILTKIRGSVYVTFNNIKDNNSLIKASGCEMTHIMTKYLEMESRKGSAIDYIQIEGPIVFVTTKGNCSFRYGIKQEVVVKQIPI